MPGISKIVKEDRQFVLDIAHDYSGTDKMNRQFIKSSVSSIPSMLPDGINLDVKSLKALSPGNDSTDLLKILLIYSICLAILHNSLISVFTQLVRFALTYLIFQLIFLISGIPLAEEWLIIPMILILQGILIQWGNNTLKWQLRIFLIALLLAWLIIRDFPPVISAGIICLTGVNILIPPDLKWFSAGFLLPLPWHGRQSSQRN